MTRSGWLVFTLILVFDRVPAGMGHPSQASGAIDDKTRSETITLIKGFAQSAAPGDWLAANKGRITSQIANEADELGALAAKQHQGNMAYSAYGFASLAHLQLGEYPLALKSILNHSQIRFMAAEKAEQYAKLHDDAVGFEKKAESIGRNDFKFDFAVLAADSAYFESRASGKTDDKVFLGALRDIGQAAPLAKYSMESAWTDRFASLTGAAVQEAMAQYHISQELFEAELKKMAPALEEAFSPDYDFKAPFGDRRKSIELARALARLSYSYGNPAVASARLAIAEQRANELGDVQLSVGLVEVRYEGERRKGGSPAELKKLRDDAWASAQKIRAAYRSRAGRIWAGYTSEELYGRMVGDELSVSSSPQMAEVFHSIEMMKARMLLDSLTAPATREIETAEMRELQHTILGFSKAKPESDLLFGEMRLISQLSGFAEMSREDTRGPALARVEKQYESLHAGFGKPAEPAPLREIQNALQPGEALLEYVIPYNALHPASDLWMLLISREKILTAHVPLDKVLSPQIGFIGRISVDGESPVDSSPLGEEVVSARVAIRKGDDKQARQYLRGLHEILIQPLIAQGANLATFKRLTIVPHGMLHYVPFPALIGRDGTFLISRVPVTVVPSASVWRILQTRQSAANRLVAFANPNLRGKGTVDLPYADQEVAAIAKLSPAAVVRVYRRDNATKERLFAEAPGASLIHISTHGEFPDEDALDLHGLWLADNGASGAALRAAEVRKLKLQARLVVLSVCNGGLYRIGPSDEPYGLIAAFLEGGAQNVMGTLWQLDDRFGRDFMIEFYKHLKNGPDVAYQAACRRFIGEDDDIRHWAGFVLIGPGRPF